MKASPRRVQPHVAKRTRAFPPLLKDESGMAMVLAISAVALLSLLGVWLVVQSGSAHRMTKSVERRESTFNLAEGALQLSWYCLQTEPDEKILKDLRKGQDVTPPASVVPYMQANQTVDNQTKATQTLSPRLIFLDHNRVPGYDMSQFEGYYYLAQGEGEEHVPHMRGGSARSEVMMVVEKIDRRR